jgi:N-methylhydantoinase A
MAYVNGPGSGSIGYEIGFAMEARYPSQVWDLEVPFDSGSIPDAAAVADLVARFHAVHRQVFAVDDPNSPIEITGWTARVRCRLRSHELPRLAVDAVGAASRNRLAYFEGAGWLDTPIYRFADLPAKAEQFGPAIVESPFTTIVIQPGSRFHATAAGGILVNVGAAKENG